MTNPAVESIVGRYVNCEIGGKNHRIYFEEAGEGTPILCLHTAGADNRQWQHILKDTDIARQHRIIAFDMPWHGKSSPPEGWETEEYLLTTSVYMETVLAVKEALGLEKPILAGCSMGGRIALQLAISNSDEFKGFIAIEASDFQPAWYDIDWFHRPDAHGGEMGAALVSANIAPQSPSEHKWLTQWMFMQSGPGVFRGDLSFYTKDDSLLETISRIDTRKAPVHIMVGEYDLTCTPENAQNTADKIDGATIRVMPKIGHFPMSENPGEFRPHFMEALDKMNDLGGM